LTQKIIKQITKNTAVSKRSVRKKKVSKKWVTLIHNGVLFPSTYESKNLSIKIGKKLIMLNAEQEERAYAWVKKLGTPYVEDNVFASNFLKEFRKILPKEYSNVKLEDIDFGEIIKFQEKEKEWKSRPEIKKKLAEERKKIRESLWGEVNIHFAVNGSLEYFPKI
jgi:DNA topoisomerase-1